MAVKSPLTPAYQKGEVLGRRPAGMLRCFANNTRGWGFEPWGIALKITNIERALKKKLPRHDKCVGVLIQDLADRGMLDDTLVVVAGEFGHTPRINGNAGRDHWPRVGHALLCGGGLKVGQVLGATDKLGSDVLDRPIHYQQVLATLYHTLGLDEDPSINDVTGRRLPILDPGIRPIGELIG